MARRRDSVKGPKNVNQGGGGFGGSGFSRGPRYRLPAVCATCGKETTVPFQPSGENLFIAVSVLYPQHVTTGKSLIVETFLGS